MRLFICALLFATASLCARADTPSLHSPSVLVYDVARGEVLLEKNADDVRPIASLTKLTTRDVVKMANEASHYPMSSSFTTLTAYAQAIGSRTRFYQDELRRVAGQPGGEQALCEAAADVVATNSRAGPSAGEDGRPE
jgi:D-alanyl-D-alanine carboxypeptidase